MIIGVPKERKVEEYRVGMLPETVSVLARRGHKVLVESNAGLGINIENKEFARAGARICRNSADIWKKSGLIVKVKEPLPEEYEFLRAGQIIFTFFHFASNIEMTKHLLTKKTECFSYELVEKNGCLPVLAPMSEVAGKLAAQEGAKYLEKEYGGKGICLSGAKGVKKGKVVIIGGGVVGTNAARIAHGMGAEVVIMDKSYPKVCSLKKCMKAGYRIVQSDRKKIRKEIRDADVVIGAVLVSGAKAPKVLKKEDLKIMEAGTVLVDVAIDQGGCFETSRPTTHENPVYEKEGIIHYCVANMPGIVPRTSTYALVAATAPYIVLLAENGISAGKNNKPLSRSHALSGGKIIHKGLQEIAACL
ncbi:MAG: alanine dehydrogenase [Candidatus Omnitrophica bacterium]|nr:alanine dehydrogenase [Candidatus Omnitrophota bacterium]